LETGVKKTALFGGTFDPLHRGHLELLRNINDELCPDRIIIIPAGHPYLKEKNGKKITPGKLRLEMLEEGLEELGLPYEISTVEMEKSGPSYSVDTVKMIREKDIKNGAEIADTDYLFLCGSDVLFSVEGWHEARKFLSGVILTVVRRSGDDIESIRLQKKKLEDEMNARVYISSCMGLDISSSMIRNAPEKYRDLIPDKVYGYILEHHLYGM